MQHSGVSHARTRLGNTTQVSRPTQQPARTLVLKRLQGANIILAYFHYCTKGLYPFSEECSDSELTKLAELDEKDVKFVQLTRKYAKHRGKSRTSVPSCWNLKG